MRGEVEVYRVTKEGESLVSKSSNLIMDGFGESFVDILTTPSSIVINGNPGQGDNFDARVDTSNYTIGSIAFGKGTLGFTKNSHDIKNTNLLGFSENLVANFSGSWGLGNWRDDSQFKGVVTSSSEVASDLSSAVVHVEASSGYKSEIANRLMQFVNSKPLHPLYDSVTFSVDMKFDFEKPSQATSSGDRFAAISISQTSSFASPYEHHSEIFNIIKWDASGRASLLSSDEDPLEEFSHGYLQDVGNGWYRNTVVLEPACMNILSSVEGFAPYWEPNGITSSYGDFGHPHYHDKQSEKLEIKNNAGDNFYVQYVPGADFATVYEGYGVDTDIEFSFYLKKGEGSNPQVRVRLADLPTIMAECQITNVDPDNLTATQTVDTGTNSFTVESYNEEWAKVTVTVRDTTGQGDRLDVWIYPKTTHPADTDYVIVSAPRLCLKSTSSYIKPDPYDITCSIYPTLPVQAKTLSGVDRLSLSVEPSSLSGAIYISRPQLSYGTAPAVYSPTSSYDNEYPDDPIMGYKVSLGSNYYGASGIGTLYYDSSAYQPVSNPPRIPNPKDSKLEYGVVLPVQSYKDYEFDIDKNLNYLGFPTYEPTLKNITKSDSIDGFGLRGDARHFGAYCPSAGATIAVLSSVDNTGFINPVSSFEYSAGVNHPDRRTMDKNGHINAYYPLRGDTQDAYGRLIVSANADFSSTGELSCICIIPSGDAAVANMYGGIFEAGLYSMDFYGNMSSLNYNTLPFSKNVDNAIASRENDAVYKLIAKKTFNDNIVVSRDNGSDAGVANHDNIKLVWKLKFL